MSQPLDPVKVAEALARHRCGMTAENVQGMADMYARKYSCRAIGKVYGVDGYTVDRLLVRSGVTLRQPGPVTVFDPEFTETVKALRASGLSWGAVAEKSGVCRTTLSKARKRGVL